MRPPSHWPSGCDLVASRLVRWPPCELGLGWGCGCVHVHVGACMWRVHVCVLLHVCVCVCIGVARACWYAMCVTRDGCVSECMHVCVCVCARVLFTWCVWCVGTV